MQPRTQKHSAAKWDYRIAHTIAFTAIGISIVQYLYRIQIVDVLAHHPAVIKLTAGFIGFAFVIIDGVTRRQSSTQERTRRLLFAAPSVAFFFALAELSSRNYTSAAAVFISPFLSKRFSCGPTIRALKRLPEAPIKS